MSLRLEKLPLPAEVTPQLDISDEVNVPSWPADVVTEQECIGRGSYGTVRVVEHKEKREMFVGKEITLVVDMDAQYQLQLFAKEIRLLGRLNHANVMSLVAFNNKPPTLYLDYVVYDWSIHSKRCDGKEVKLTSDLGGFLRTQRDYKNGVRYFHETRNAVQRVASDLAEGLAYLHAHGISHRDLKPQNVLLGNNRVRPFVCRITDFGEARGEGYDGRTLPDDLHTNRFQRGTLSYMAPEVLHPESARFGSRPLLLSTKDHADLERIDVWAFGMILFMTVNPDMPSPYLPPGGAHGDLYQTIIGHMERRQVPDHSTEYGYLKSDCTQVVQAIASCLQYDPLLRPDMSTLAKQLEGKWLRTWLKYSRKGGKSKGAATINVDKHLEKEVVDGPAAGPTVDELFDDTTKVASQHDSVFSEFTEFATAVQAPVASFDDFSESGISTCSTTLDHVTRLAAEPAKLQKDTLFAHMHSGRIPNLTEFKTRKPMRPGPRQTLEQHFERDEMEILRKTGKVRLIQQSGHIASVQFREGSVMITGTAEDIFHVVSALYSAIDKGQAEQEGFVQL